MEDRVLEVINIEKACEGVFRLDLKSDTKLPDIKAGQFINLEVPDNSLILRRPFCVYDFTADTVTVYAAIIGKGTLSLSQVKIGEKLKAILPLGNGFDISRYNKIGLLGGGMGCAALHTVAKQKDKEFYAYFGYANKDKVLFEQDFKAKTKKLTICTDDGSYGVKGYPINELQKDSAVLDAILICGPMGLVKSAKKVLEGVDIPVYVSMEQRMACGVGACLVCTCAVNEQNLIKNKRVCADGPVFNLNDLVF